MPAEWSENSLPSGITWDGTYRIEGGRIEFAAREGSYQESCPYCRSTVRGMFLHYVKEDGKFTRYLHRCGNCDRYYQGNRPF